LSDAVAHTTQRMIRISGMKTMCREMRCATTKTGTGTGGQ
jgi:hypothetical protein